MSFNNLPASIQSVIQQGFLERQFQDALRAKLGFRAIADREPFMAGVGESITKTRTGLLPVVTTPMAPASNTDLTSGLTPVQYGVEQYILAIEQYGAPMMLNIATARVAIDSLFLKNAYTLGENGARSVDALAQRALFDAYEGGNTRVTTTLGAPGTTVQVDDVRGFFNTLNSAGQPVAVSGSNTMLVVVGSSTYTLTGVTADGAQPTMSVPWLANLAFSGTGSNTSTTPGGYSGVLTFSANVSTSNGTALNAVVAATAPLIMRPTNNSTGVMCPTTAAIAGSSDYNFGFVTMQMLLQAKATLSSNGVPPPVATGRYGYYASPLQLTGLFRDPAFQQLFRGQPESKEFRTGLVADLLGIEMIETNLNPVQNLSGVGTIHRGILCGQGALVEGVFTATEYTEAAKVNENGLITIVDDIAHVTRAPIDTVQQVVTQSWLYAGGFVAPTDALTNPNTIPTASNASLKRAMIVESF